MTADRLENFGASLLQHGPASDRVYLMKLAAADLPALLDHIDGLVARHGYSKVFAKVPAAQAEAFSLRGYVCEARVPGFYRGCDDGWFLARYADPARQQDPAADQVAEVLQLAQAKARSPRPQVVPDGLVCRLATAADCDAMAELYRQVFASYPFPIHQPDYLRQTLAEQVRYAGIWRGGQLLALASAEMDVAAGHAEMTDFATRPDARGQGLAHLLLQFLERHMPQEGVQLGYTIARATSFGMNITFSQCGYRFGGTLVRNTQISGGLESMNVWYRPLVTAPTAT